MTMAATPTKGRWRPGAARLGLALLAIALAAPALGQEIYVSKGEDGVELFSNLPREGATVTLPSVARAPRVQTASASRASNLPRIDPGAVSSEDGAAHAEEPSLTVGSADSAFPEAISSSTKGFLGED